VKLGLVLPHEGELTFAETRELTLAAESAGFDSVWVPEAWGLDAVSTLGALAASTSRIRLATGIINVFSRSPALIAQTTATLDLISNGRVILGLGTSGHQVIAGWHGVDFDRPLTRLRETVEIVRSVLRREPLVYQKEIFTLTQGLKLRAKPIRSVVPIFLATLTPGGLRLTGEVADGWMPTLLAPERMDLFLPDLEEGARKAGRSVADIDIAAAVSVSIDDDRERARETVRPWVAFYVGGMGSRTKNFYNETVRRYGFTDDAIAIQELYLTGKRLEATRRVPDALLDLVTIAGPMATVSARFDAYAAAGVGTIVTGVHSAPTQEARLRTIEQLAAVAQPVG
jgi:F420-dependent oxidoreductase-like protein